MAYMVYQQLTNAVKENYAGDPDISQLHAEAQACVRYLQSLRVKPELINPIIEPITYIEEGFRELLASRSKQQ